MIYELAQVYGHVIIISKDSDFIELIDWYGSPPKLILIKFGNCSNKVFWKKLKPRINSALELLLNEKNEVSMISIT
ncbi:putative nuclease of putative toxin-antitoxin system [Pedobacter sp. UYP30]